MSIKEKVKSAVAIYEYLTKRLAFPIAIEAIENTTFPLPFRAVYGHLNIKESTGNRCSHLFEFDPSRNPSIRKLPIFPSSQNDIILESLSPSKKLRINIKKQDKSTFIEIWSKGGFLQGLKLDDIHGSIYSSAEIVARPFGWSSDETKIIYIAEAKEDKKLDYFSPLSSDDDVQKVLKNYEFKDDLGEEYEKKYNPKIFIYSLKENKIQEVEGIPEDLLPTYASFVNQDGSALVFAGMKKEILRRGIAPSINREVSIYYMPKIELKQEKTPRKPKIELISLTKDDIATIPVISNDLKKLIYFFSPKSLTHTFTMGLKTIDLTSENLKQSPNAELSLDIVKEYNPEFSGVVGFHDPLIKAHWLSDSIHFVFNSAINGGVGLFILNTKTREVKRLDKPKFVSQVCRISSVHDDIIFVTISSPETPNQFALCEGLNLKGTSIEEVIKDVKWHIYNLDTTSDDQASQFDFYFSKERQIQEEIINLKGIQSTFFSLKESKTQDTKLPLDKERPLVIILHGGPHHASYGGFDLFRDYLLHNCYNIVMPNYTGSVGFGQKHIEGLPGKINDIEIKEIKEVIDYCIGKGLGNPKKLVLVGNSFGGFLSFHLMARYPELFRCALIKNPVVNIANVSLVSDTPEWATTEVLNKEFDPELTTEEFVEMYQKSPISQNKEFKTSVLLQLGGKDRRVPPAATIYYYKMLKQKGNDVQMYFYPNENHRLSGNVDVDFDIFVHNVLFLEEKMNLSI